MHHIIKTDSVEIKFQDKLQDRMEEWSSSKDIFPHRPIGKSVDIATTLWIKYGEEITLP